MNAKKPNNTYTTYRRIHGFNQEFRSYETQELFVKVTKQNQKVRILNISDGVGLCLEINDDVMALQCNEDFLHKQMVHLGFSNLNAKRPNITILGGGDGGVLKHCLNINPKSVKLLEIDEEIINICRKYLPHISENSFDDTRVKIIIGNAFETVKKIRKNTQHLVFVDMADPASEQDNRVFGENSKSLLTNIDNCLKVGGIVVAQASAFQQQTLTCFKKFFKKTYGWTDNFDLQNANSFVYAIK